LATFETEAVVLKQFDLGESDRLITLYTKDKGKIKAVARGARKGNKSRSGLVLPFSYHNFILYKGRSLAKINHIDSIALNSNLRKDLEFMAYASVVSEYIERAGLEDEADEALFSLLVIILEKMNHCNKDDLFFYLCVFQSKLLLLLGVKPEIENCTICGDKMDLEGKTAFSIKNGGSVCSNCLDTKINSYDYLTLNQLRALYKIIFAEIRQLKAEDFSEDILKKIGVLTEKFLAYHLDLKPKSLKFLYTIKSMSK
jgi:DNA repair protein RecO (recombination protein O)